MKWRIIFVGAAAMPPITLNNSRDRQRGWRLKLAKVLMDFKLAWRNIWRNPRRSVLTMSAVAFAALLLVFMLSWQFGSYATMINASVEIQTGHLHILPKGYYEDRDIRKVISDPKSVAKLIERIPGIKAYTFRAEAFSLVSSKEHTLGTLVVGVDPDKEAAVSTIKHIIRKGATFSEQDQAEVLICDANS